MVDDHIARRARVLFADTRRGNMACSGLKRLENILRHSRATGRREMARECAEFLREVATGAREVPLPEVADVFDLFAKEAEAEEKRWR